MSEQLQKAFSARSRLDSGVGYETLETINQLAYNEELIDPVAWATTKAALNDNTAPLMPMPKKVIYPKRRMNKAGLDLYMKMIERKTSNNRVDVKHQGASDMTNKLEGMAQEAMSRYDGKDI